MISDAPTALKDLFLGIRRTIAVAESLTGGRLQATISSVSGASDYFDGGVTAYNLKQKVNLLGVDRNHAAEVNCVSPRVAIEMAAGVRTMFGTFVGVATTGYAEPCPERNVVQPLAHYAIDIGGWITSGRIGGANRTRLDMQQHVADSALRRLIDAFDRLTQMEAPPKGLHEIQRSLRRRLMA